MAFRDFVYSVENPWAWGIILLLSLRAVYKCLVTKDYAHFAAFFVVALGATYMLGAIYGWFELPTVFSDK